MRELIARISPNVWRFVMSLAFLLLAYAVVASIHTSVRQRDEALAALQQQEKVAAAERAKASTERQTILTSQRDIQRKYSALVAWLDTQGIPVPPEVLSGAFGNDDDDDDSDDGGGDDATARSGGPSKSGTVTNPPTNSGADSNSDSGGSGSGNGGGNSDGPGGSSGGGASSEKSHGQNAGGKSDEHSQSKNK